LYSPFSPNSPFSPGFSRGPIIFVLLENTYEKAENPEKTEKVEIFLM
jgi:hypothetical protein